jgi:hypothetical protein
MAQTTTINEGQISTNNVQLLNAQDTLEVFGHLATINGQPSVTMSGNPTSLRVASSGDIISDQTAVQVNGTNAQIVNEGYIDGVMNGIFLEDGDRAYASLLSPVTEWIKSLISNTEPIAS